ncbi:hypothetical protein DOTSEDRAFT_73902 [Dothistroma septosporum NZE10]|uniref:Uncharacterized protein n=1 Tax=Dothistroma septosporum (strain NZE10 / CBS 128990) TaxID=675120 RepID=N1PK39_DOTSN|nr:hypothetical protein DOTSEDRAFT_73902 [Dothistroma septosporum NZE10]
MKLCHRSCRWRVHARRPALVGLPRSVGHPDIISLPDPEHVEMSGLSSLLSRDIASRGSLYHPSRISYLGSPRWCALRRLLTGQTGGSTSAFTRM